MPPSRAPMTPARRLFAIDLRSLAVFRMGLAAWILADLLLRAPDVASLLSDGGLLPGPTVLAHSPPALTLWSLYFCGASPLAQGCVMAAQAVAAVLLFVGFRTRLMTFLSWLFLVSLDARNPLVIGGWDTLAELMTFWGMFVPLGATLSVDGAGRELDEPREFSTGTIAMLSQVVLLYVFAGLHKHQAPAWRDGTAVLNALGTPELAHAPGALLAGYPRLIGALTHAVVYFEVLGPLALFSPVFHVPLRLAATLGFVFLQVGFGACLAVSLFPFISTTVMTLFIPTELWDRYPWLERRLAAPFAWPARALARWRAREPRWQLVRWERGLVALLVLYVAVWNLATLDRRFLENTGRRTIPLEGRGYRPPHPICWLGLSLKLNQAMTMFLGPDGSTEWHEVHLKFSDGSKSDLFLDGARLVATPPDPSRQFGLAGARFGNFWAVLPGYPWAHTHVGAYLCRTWRAEHPGEPRLVELTLYRVHQQVSGDPRSAIRRWPVFGHLCAVEDGELEP